jgi:hypothetical protein
MSKVRTLVRRIIERKKRLMDAPSNFSLGFAEGTGPKTETPPRLFDRQSFRQIWTATSLVTLSLGFSVFGILIIVNRHQANLDGLSGDSLVATAGGIGGLAIGICFLVAACLHWRTISGSSGGNFIHTKRTEENLNRTQQRRQRRKRIGISEIHFGRPFCEQVAPF